jgi:hypothetical protein
MNSKKTPLYIVKRPTGETLVTLKFDYLLKILEDLQFELDREHRTG